MRTIFKNKKDQEIIVVSGLPRSGTSMMMKMLEAGGVVPFIDNIRQADGDNPNGYYEFERVKKLPEGDYDWLIEAKGKAVKIIATLIPYLPSDYSYKVLFMNRDLSEVLASQRKMLERKNHDLEDYDEHKIGFLLKKNLVDVRAYLNRQREVLYLDCDYNTLIQSPDETIRNIISFLNLNLDFQNMVDIINPDLYRQRK